MIQSPDPDKTNWICHVALAPPKSQLKWPFAEELTFDFFFFWRRICELTKNMLSTKSQAMKMFMGQRLQTQIYHDHIIEIFDPNPHQTIKILLDFKNGARGSTSLPITQCAIQHLSHSPIQTQLYTDGRGFSARCRPAHQERYSPSSLKHPGYISGQPFTRQEQPPGAIWGSVSRWRPLHRETGGNIEALTFQLLYDLLYLMSHSHEDTSWLHLVVRMVTFERKRTLAIV